MLRTIMTTAVDDGLLPSNPVHIKGASKERAIERPLLSWDDVAALAVAIHPRFEALVWAAAASGLRFGELSGLTVRHVDIERSEIRVSQSLSYERGRGSTLGPPKTDSAHRTVAIPEAVTERIVAHMRNFDVGREPGSSPNCESGRDVQESRTGCGITTVGKRSVGNGSTSMKQITCWSAHETSPSPVHGSIDPEPRFCGRRSRPGTISEWPTAASKPTPTWLKPTQTF